jgi:hypothetical protein
MDGSPFSPMWDLSESKMVHFADQVILFPSPTMSFHPLP